MFRPRLRTPAALGGNSIISISSSGASSLLARQSAQSALAPLSQARRSIHLLPVSRHDPYVGVPSLLSAEGYDLAWTQQMTLMLNRLNQLTAGTEYENLNLKTIVQETARFPHLASTFNHASMALNTDFFFKQLLPATSPEAASASREIPATLRAAIEDNFSSVETLRLEFAAIAAGMFGPGFIWLVKANNLHQSGRGGDNLRLLTTYHAGSPFPGAHYRRQAVDMNNVGAEMAIGSADLAAKWLSDQGKAASHGAPPPPPPPPAVGAAGAVAGAAADAAAAAALGQQVDKRPPGGADIIPLLCLSTWEHVWLRDYGVGADGYGGKAGFVDAWWKAIDWEAVDALANLNRPKLKV